MNNDDGNVIMQPQNGDDGSYVITGKVVDEFNIEYLWE